MLIKFVKPDPRAGAVARMDSGRGQQLIDAGAAVLATEDAEQGEAAQPLQPQEPAPAAKLPRQRKPSPSGKK